MNKGKNIFSCAWTYIALLVGNIGAIFTLICGLAFMLADVYYNYPLTSITQTIITCSCLFLMLICVVGIVASIILFVKNKHKNDNIKKSQIVTCIFIGLLLPIVYLVTFLGIAYICSLDAYKQKQTNYEYMIDIMNALSKDNKNDLEKDFDYREYYTLNRSSYSYHFYFEEDSNLVLYWGNDCTIDGMEYNISLDVNKTKEENFEIAKEKLDNLENIMAQYEVDCSNKKVFNKMKILKEFEEDFLSSDSYFRKDGEFICEIDRYDNYSLYNTFRTMTKDEYNKNDGWYSDYPEISIEIFIYYSNGD